MNCTEVRELLSAWLDRELPLDRSWRVEQHLRDCASCSREVEELRELVGWIADVPRVRVPADLSVAIRERLRQAEPERPRMTLIARYKGPVQAIAALAAVLAVVVVNRFSYAPPAPESRQVVALPSAEFELRAANDGTGAPVDSLRKKAGSVDSTEKAKKAGLAQAPGAPEASRAAGGRTGAAEDRKQKTTAGLDDHDRLEQKERQSKEKLDKAVESLGTTLRDGLEQQKGQTVVVHSDADEQAEVARNGETGAPADRANFGGLAKDGSSTAPAEEVALRKVEEKLRELEAGRESAGLGLFSSTSVVTRVVRAPREELVQTLADLESELRKASASWVVEETVPGRKVVRATVAASRAPRLLAQAERGRFGDRGRRQALAGKGGTAKSEGYLGDDLAEEESDDSTVTRAGLKTARADVPQDEPEKADSGAVAVAEGAARPAPGGGSAAGAKMPEPASAATAPPKSEGGEAGAAGSTAIAAGEPAAGADAAPTTEGDGGGANEQPAGKPEGLKRGLVAGAEPARTPTTGEGEYEKKLADLPEQAQSDPGAPPATKEARRARRQVDKALAEQVEIVIVLVEEKD